MNHAGAGGRRELPNDNTTLTLNGETDPLHSLRSYSRYLAKLLDQLGIRTSTVTAWSDSRYTGIAEGEVLFTNGLRLRMREEIGFDAGIISFDRPNLPFLLQEIEEAGTKPDPE